MPHLKDSQVIEGEHESELAKASVRSTKKWWENSFLLWVTQSVLGAAFMLQLGYVVLWMDSHNDNRYLQKVDYKRDSDVLSDRYRENRENDRKDRDSIRNSATQDKNDLNKRLDRQELQLDTISNDIKSLLRSK